METELNNENFHEETFEEEPQLPVESDDSLTESESEQNLSQEEENSNSSEAQVEEPIQESIQEPGLDDKHFQSIADKRLAELTKEKLEKERLQAELEALKNPPKPQEELVEPIPPERPADYDINDVYDPGSSTYKFEQDFRKYQYDLAKYNSNLVKQLNAEKQSFEKQREATAAKANFIGELTSKGLSAQEAHDVHSWATEFFSDKGLTAERLISIYNYEKAKKSTPQINLQKSQIEQRNGKKKMVVPPGVLGADSPKAETPDDVFNDQLISGNKYRL
jgi:hypothetical protein